MNNKKTKTTVFNAADVASLEMHANMLEVYHSLLEKGYNPINQIVGYILTEDPTYITNHKNARVTISKVDRDKLLAEMLKEYLQIDK